MPRAVMMITSIKKLQHRKISTGSRLRKQPFSDIIRKVVETFSATNRDLQEKNMKIIWIDGTFGIGKSAVAAAIVEEIPQAHLLEFDALQEKYKPTSVSDRFGKRYPEAKKYLVDALVDEITEIIQEGSCDCLVIPVALINDYCNQKLIDGFANIESHHFILTAKKEILLQRINNQENRDIDLAVTYMPEATQYLSNHYYDASRIDTSNMSIDSVAKEIIESITR
jgi:adenylate kinase family enzyme|nr:MAG TPA: AAA domain protein [Caudoviricetes sp.]